MMEPFSHFLLTLKHNPPRWVLGVSVLQDEQTEAQRGDGRCPEPESGAGSEFLLLPSACGSGSALLSPCPCIDQPHLSTGPGLRLRTKFSWNCGTLSLLTKHKTILDYFRSRIISLHHVMFLLLACPSRMKGANIKAFSAAFY